VTGLVSQTESHNPSPGSATLATFSPRERAKSPKTHPSCEGRGWSRVAGPGEGSFWQCCTKNLTQEIKFQTSSLLVSCNRSSRHNSAPKERHNLAHSVKPWVEAPSLSPFPSPARAGEGCRRRGEGLGTQGSRPGLSYCAASRLPNGTSEARGIHQRPSVTVHQHFLSHHRSRVTPCSTRRGWWRP
jgi:hypothetical protein